MTLKRALAGIRYWLASLFLECGFAVAVLAALPITALIIFILGAQFLRLATTGDWRGFAFSEFIDVLQLDPSVLFTASDHIDKFVLSLPATLVLSVAAAAFCLLAGVARRLNRRERARFVGKQQHALIEDIERKLQTR
jgi:hypothetical protein